MKKNDRQRLEQLINSIQTWTHERSIFGIQDAFLNLTLYLDINKNQDLWKKLRKVLSENEALKDEEIRTFLTNKQFAEQDHWWWDPEKWENE